jgi:hypothetical protein
VTGNADQLAFLLHFACVRLESQDRNGWKELRRRMARFLAWRGPTLSIRVTCGVHAGLLNPSPATPSTATEAQYHELQSRVRELVSGIIDTQLRATREARARVKAIVRGGDDWGWEFLVTYRSLPVRLHMVVRPQIHGPAPQARGWALPNLQVAPMELQAEAGLEDAVIFMTCMVLWMNAATAVRTCKACGSLFLARRRDSKCCSTKCNRALYWTTPKGRKALAKKYEDGGWRLGARKRNREPARPTLEERRAAAEKQRWSGVATARNLSRANES